MSLTLFESDRAGWTADADVTPRIVDVPQDGSQRRVGLILMLASAAVSLRMLWWGGHLLVAVLAS